MKYQQIIGEINKHLYKATERMPAWLFRCFKKNPNYWRDFVLTKLSVTRMIMAKGLRMDELIAL